MPRTQLGPTATVGAGLLLIALLATACGASAGAGGATPAPTGTPLAAGASAPSVTQSASPAETPPYPVHRSGYQFRGHTVPDALAKPDFTLTDTSGKTFDFRKETHGFVTLLYFGYTHCPDVCPTHMADVASVLARDEELASRVKVVFVTVDPDRDTEERLRSWLGLFDADFIGLRGTLAEVVAACRAALGGMYLPIDKQRYGDGQYAMSHASIVVAYGTDNVARVVFPAGTRQADYESDLRALTGLDER